MSAARRGATPRGAYVLKAMAAAYDTAEAEGATVVAAAKIDGAPHPATIVVGWFTRGWR